LPDNVSRKASIIASHLAAVVVPLTDSPKEAFLDAATGVHFHDHSQLGKESLLKQHLKFTSHAWPENGEGTKDMLTAGEMSCSSGFVRMLSTAPDYMYFVVAKCTVQRPRSFILYIFIPVSQCITFTFASVFLFPPPPAFHIASPPTFFPPLLADAELSISFCQNAMVESNLRKPYLRGQV
jgi:hypothetical protein